MSAISEPVAEHGPLLTPEEAAEQAQRELEMRQKMREEVDKLPEGDELRSQTESSLPSPPMANIVPSALSATQRTDAPKRSVGSCSPKASPAAVSRSASDESGPEPDKE